MLSALEGAVWRCFLSSVAGRLPSCVGCTTMQWTQADHWGSCQGSYRQHNQWQPVLTSLLALLWKYSPQTWKTVEFLETLCTLRSVQQKLRPTCFVQEVSLRSRQCHPVEAWEHYDILLALPQHQHTSFLCPDVSERIALSFFKELSKVPWKRTGQSSPKRQDKENSCAGAEGELKD